MAQIATQKDIDGLKKILTIVTAQETTDEFHVDWENAELQFTLRRVINNLEHFDKYFKKLPETEKNWFDAECDNCGWFGSSQWLNGGGAIADTGDHDDTTCPICDKPI